MFLSKYDIHKFFSMVPTLSVDNYFFNERKTEFLLYIAFIIFSIIDFIITVLRIYIFVITKASSSNGILMRDYIVYTTL